MKKIFVPLLITLVTIGLYSCKDDSTAKDLRQNENSESSFIVDSDVESGTALSDLLPWASLMNKDNVKEVILEHGYIGAAPEHELESIYTSDDIRDIEYNLNFLKLSKVTLSNYDIYGGSYQTVTYVTDKESYSLKIANNFVFIDTISYRLINDVRPLIQYGEKENEVKLLTLGVNIDYGFHILNKACLLIGYSNIPKEIMEQIRVSLVGGDRITIKYTGQILVYETYPSTMDLSNAVIKGVIVEMASSIEFFVAENPGGGTSLCHFDSSKVAGKFLTTKVINEDGSFANYFEYEVGSKIYGFIPVGASDNEIISFYSYNPR